MLSQLIWQRFPRLDGFVYLLSARVRRTKIDEWSQLPCFASVAPIFQIHPKIRYKIPFTSLEHI